MGTLTGFGIKSAVLDTVATHTAAVFYAIFGTVCQSYWQGNRFAYVGEDISTAQRFPTVKALLKYVEECGEYLSPIEIRRVEEITVKSTEQRRILDHGEQAPEGAEIKFVVVNPYAPLTRYMKNCTLSEPTTISLDDVALFPTELAAVERCVSVSKRFYAIRRVAITRTPAKPEYKVTVLA